MKPWNEFSQEAPELAEIGRNLLFRSRPHVGLAFLATLRKDGAPRLHPVSLVYWNHHLYVLIPTGSPKCRDLQHDGRYALQAFPSHQNKDNQEFYLAGHAELIGDLDARQTLIAETGILVEEDEVLFELYMDRAMHTKLVEQDTPQEHPVHTKWRASE